MAAPGDVPVEAVEPLPIKEVEDGVFVHTGAIDLMRAANEGAIANIGFVVGTRSVAIVDSGGSTLQGRRLMAAVRAVTDLPIRHVVNTHMHPDHVFGNAAFLGGETTFVGHANLGAALAARREAYLASNVELMGEALMAEVAIVPPSLSVAAPIAIDLGDRRLLLTPWPTAHTDNDLTVLDEKTGTLFAGDLVFLDHCPTLDGSLLGWLGAMGALRALPARQVVPGHGPATASWPAALDDEERYLETLAADLRAALAKGETLSEAVATAAASEAGRWQLFEEYNTRNATGAFAELEWE
ncbi:MAG: quinoprotein relay system zinc metallohydrolase 2 [Rhizobiaceae bacterium]|nr:quinoprotein relay system zinc metallohydrolase 2 [Rhizobiaceae bacterium]